MALDSDAAFTYTDGVAFPNNTAVNASGAGATDGTEFVKLMVDNYLFGPQQALLSLAGLTPTGVSESASASQTIEAINKGFNVGPGFRVMPDLNATETAKYRILPQNGQGVLRATYPDLDTATYVGDANNATVAAAGGGYYRADDAAGTIPNIVGIYLILPESRGYTPRGLDTSATVDPGGATRVLGDNQDFALENITGTFRSRSLSGGQPMNLEHSGAFSTGTDGAASLSATGNATTVNIKATVFDASTVAQTSTETRMTNIATNFAVGY